MSSSDTRNNTKQPGSNEDAAGKKNKPSIDCMCFDPLGKEAEILATILQDEHDVRYQKRLGLCFFLVGVIAYFLLMLAEPITRTIDLHYNVFTVDFWSWSNVRWFAPVIIPTVFGVFLRYSAVNMTLDWWYRVRENELHLSLLPTRHVNLMITIVVIASAGVTALLFTI
jgi:hypothetical protein